MIGIIFLLNVRYAPYINKYTDILIRNNKDFEIIYWDRLNSPDAPKEWKSKVFNYNSRLDKSKITKISDFLKFRKFVIQTIESQKYEKLIVLTTLTGIFLADKLLKNYSDNYILDIRDYSFEKNPIYKKLVSKLVEKSNFTTISSEGFKNFLPESKKYIKVHNFRHEDIMISTECARERWNAEEKIKISFLGSIRHFELDTKFIETFINDNRYILEYIGDGPHYVKLKKYIIENNYDVNIPGRYHFKDKSNILQNVNLINGYYDDKEYINKFAVSNKFYDSLIYKIPLLVNKDVYLGDIVRENYLGITINLETHSEKSSITNYIYEYLKEFDYNKFEKKCNEMLQDILLEDQIFEQKLSDFISST